MRNSRLLITLVFLSIFIGCGCNLYAQNDTLQPNPNDSINLSVNSGTGISAKIEYSARDSIRFSMALQKVYLYGNASVNYESIELKAGYMEIDFNARSVFATGIIDSTGALTQLPTFKDGEQSFESDTIKYNYESKKGIIYHIYSQQGDAYLHGDKVKKMPNDEILVSHGAFTTCSLKDPHFEIRFNKAKVIPDDKIVTGPVWLVIEDVPTPLALPFGFFPNKKGRKSGILIPTYGESATRGFYLENGGYYFGISDKVDLSLRGDIYSRGSWALKAQSNYKVRYRYEGNLNISYSVNRFGDKDSPDFEKYSSFFIKWRHNQDPKARPNSRFTADVQAGSSNYNTFNPSSAQDYLSNNFASNISYSTVIARTFNFSANFRHNQNKQTHAVSLNLPEIAMSTNRIYPFRRKEPTGKLRFYENISFSYVMNARNSINTVDSLLFDQFDMNHFDNGVRHSIPLSFTQKIFRYFTLTNSFNQTLRQYFRTIEKRWNAADSSVVTDTVPGHAMNYDFNLSTMLSFRVYTLATFKGGPLMAVRYMLTPSVSFTWRPDFSAPSWGYYQYYSTSASPDPLMYSIFEGSMYGYSPAGKSSQLNVSLANNLEIKVRHRKDSIGGFKKIVLIENLTLGASHNFAADSLRWSYVSVSGRTKLFKNLDIRYAALLDPYIVDSSGINLNQYEWDINRRPWRQNTGEWGASLNWMLNQASFKSKRAVVDSTQSHGYEIPWNLQLSYTMQYSRDYRTGALEDKKFIQTLSFSGDIRLTPNWKIGIMSGYDFVNHDFSYTSVNVYRDLHCWEIIFNWIPSGYRKSYNMTIRVKSSILQDLKVTKKTDWRDYY